MHHVFYSDGNAGKISWVIQTRDSTVEQSRKHAEIYMDKVTNLQSKYVALHVGLFWGVGVFIIKNNDIVKIKLDDKTMYNHFTSNSKIEDEFIKKRIHFIKQLIEQRKINIEFQMIDTNKNLAKKSINAKGLKTKNE